MGSIGLNNPLVSVDMITFNHGPYISQAIEGVLMQQTNFRFELVIGEDCSYDSTLKICEEYAKNYPDIIRLLPSERHLGMILNGDRTFEACAGKYIAICEGDDYWTDPHKLQKQIDFLETNQEYGLSNTDAHFLYQSENSFFYNANKAQGRINNALEGKFPDQFYNILLYTSVH